MRLKPIFQLVLFSPQEEKQVRGIITQTRNLIAVYSNPDSIDATTRGNLSKVVDDIRGLTDRIKSGYEGLTPTKEALSQAPWGVTSEEIPLLPMTPRGVMFDEVAKDVTQISEAFLTLRNMPLEASQLIENTRADIKTIKDNINNTNAGADIIDVRKSYMKSVERIFKRLDDGMIFPANTLDEVNDSVAVMIDGQFTAKGSLGIVDALFMPGAGVVKTRTICIEQGSSRWLPKPTDVVATSQSWLIRILKKGAGLRAPDCYG